MLRDLHVAWAWVVVIGNGVAGGWALAANWIHPLRIRALWWFTIAVEVAIGVQVAVGVGLVSGQDMEVDSFHMFYGYVALIAVALIYSYRPQLQHRLHLLYGFGGLFLMGLGIRAMLLG
jgi:hypothetical protein